MEKPITERNERLKFLVGALIHYALSTIDNRDKGVMMLFNKLMWISVGTDSSRPSRQSKGQEDAMNWSLPATYPEHFVKSHN